MLRRIPLGLTLLYRYYPVTWRILWLTFYYCCCSCFLFLLLYCYGKMQFFIYCNFFCQKNKFTYLLTLLTYFGPVWLIAPKVILPSCRKHLCLSGGKNLTSSTMLLWRYCKDMQTYFGYFGHAWLHSPKMIVSPCWRFQCLSACKK